MIIAKDNGTTARAARPREKSSAARVRPASATGGAAPRKRFVRSPVGTKASATMGNGHPVNSTSAKTLIAIAKLNVASQSAFASGYEKRESWA